MKELTTFAAPGCTVGLNRVLRVTLDGQLSEMIAFGNIVPTRLEISDHMVYMRQAGPIPHLLQDGKVVVLDAKFPGDTAFVVTLTGKVIRIDNVSSAHRGAPH